MTMDDRNRLLHRVFHYESRNLDNHDDDLAPVVLAIDAVQQLMEEESRDSAKATKRVSEIQKQPTSEIPTDVKGPEQSTPVASTSSSMPPQSVRVAEQTVAKVTAPKVEPTYEYRAEELVAPEIVRYESNSLVRNTSRIKIEESNSEVKNQQDEYEFIPKSLILDVYSNDPEVKRFLKQLPKICNEYGFNEQDYKCYSCRRPVGMVFGESRLCHFDGHHYCPECHLGEKSVIPARILCNWDFNKYPISKRNQHFLALISNESMFELKKLAPLLYKTCPDLIGIEELRSQAFFIRSYCFTCAQDSISLDLTKLVWPRDHLIKQTDTYSFEDLIQIKTGALKQVLRNVISFGRQHVLSCVLCCQKGFICELCKSSQIIYPFDTESVHRCNNCQSIYHKACFDAKIKPDSESCPRCQRLLARKSEN